MSLTEIRQQLDQLDQQLVVLLEKRYALIEQVADQKSQQQLATEDLQREKEILSRIAEQVQQEKYQLAIQQTFQEIMNVSKDWQINN